eukprot:365810-Chlamydomonas_euryale.AAC.37
MLPLDGWLAGGTVLAPICTSPAMEATPQRMRSLSSQHAPHQRGNRPRAFVAIWLSVFAFASEHTHCAMRVPRCTLSMNSQNASCNMQAHRQAGSARQHTQHQAACRRVGVRLQSWCLFWCPFSMRCPCSLSSIACFVSHRHSHLGPLTGTLTLTQNGARFYRPDAPSGTQAHKHGAHPGARCHRLRALH